MPKTFPFPVHERTLPNGLKTIVIPMDAGGLVSYYSVVRTGSRDEYEAQRTGFAHFFEHMMFRGSENFPAEAYNEAVTRMGADTNAFTSSDLTAYYLTFAAEDLEQVIVMEADRFQRLEYAEQAFKDESGAVYGEYRKSLASPGFALHEKTVETAFSQHTYGHTTIGYEADIALMPTLYEYSWAFWNRYYRPENVVLLVVGSVDPERVFTLVLRHYAAWERGYVPPSITPEPPQTAERRVDVSFRGRTPPMLRAAYKFDAYDPADKNVLAATLLAELAFGETSDLAKKLVLDEQRLLSLRANAALSRDPYLFTIDATIKSEADIDAVLAEIDRTAARFREQLVDAEKLARVKSQARYGFLMSLDAAGRIAGRLARFIALTGGVDAIDTHFATLDAVTPEDVRRAAQRYLVSERRTVAVLREAQP